MGSGIITDCVAGNNYIGIEILGPGNILGNNANNNSLYNFYVGAGVATSIMADRNSAFGLNPNYYVPSGTTGILWGLNSGSP